MPQAKSSSNRSPKSIIGERNSGQQINRTFSKSLRSIVRSFLYVERRSSRKLPRDRATFAHSRVTRLRHNAHFHPRDISRQSCLLVKDPKIHPPELESSSFALVISTMGTSHVPRVVEISIPHTEWIVSLSLPLSLSLSLCGGGSRVQFASGRRGGSVYSARFKPWRLYGCVSLSLGDDGRESSR